MKIKIREYKDITILEVEGRIDIDASEFIEMVGWVLKNNKLKILCNFENVDLVDYSGLSILAIAYKNVVNHNGVIKFCNVSLHIRELFHMAQMDKVFQCFETEKGALLSFDETMSDLEKRRLRRRFKRIETNISVDFRPKDAKDEEAKYFRGKVLNISGAGLFIYTPNVFPIKTKLNIEILLPHEIAPIGMEGIVIWIAERNIQPDCYPGMGVQFINVNAEKQKELLDFIDKNITYRSET